MADACTAVKSLCAYFILFLWIPSIISTKDHFLYYNTEGHHQRSEYALDLELLDSIRLEKRSLPIGSELVDNNSNSNATNITDITEKSKLKFMKNYKPPISTTVTPQMEYPIKLAPDNANNKLLGVNGTGQRKNITTVPIKIFTTQGKVETFNNNETIAVKNNQTNGDDADISITKFNDKEDGDFHKILADHNITKTKTDTHLYYNSTVTTDEETGHSYWVDLNNHTNVKINDLLSKSHRRAATVKLSFDFPFYGHLIRNVTIATGGFLYTGDYVHSWLAATQYIAPLMANFDTSISNDSYIKYLDNGTAFTVEWDKVSLQDKPNEGEFTFQVTLHKNGDIVFVYQNVPLFIRQIEDDHHPVKVGLSDAYIIDRTIFFVRRKTIYEYHRVNFFKEDIKNWTTIYLTALPTCLDSKDCITCLTRKRLTFNCMWCPSISRCSNGLDRNRQDWLTKGCDKKQFGDEKMCSHISTKDIFDESDTTYSHDSNQFNAKRGDYQEQTMKTTNRIYNDAIKANQPVRMGMSGIVATLFLIAMIGGLGIWIMYAYRNPHTTSGQILIRYRPSQWRWRRGEARYTAATIHM